MRRVTLKADEEFYLRLNRLSDSLHLSKSEVIRRAVAIYEATLERNSMKKRFKEASFKVRKANREIIEDFDVTLMDGIDD